MNFKTKTKGCQLSVNVKTSVGETIDKKELDRFSRIYMRGFLKPQLLKPGVVEYTGPVGISLSERLKKPISKRDFLFILEQIVVVVQKLQENKLGINNMVMNPRYVYINEATKEIRFIYIPLVKGIPNQNLLRFIEALAYSVKPANGSDPDFASRFMHFFRALRPFDINKMEAYIANEDRSVVYTIKKQNVGQSGFITNKPQNYYNHYEKIQKELNDEATGLLNEEEATGLLNEFDDGEATGLLNDYDDGEATGLLSDFDDGEATGLLNDFDDGEATGLLNDFDDGEATGLLNDFDDGEATGLLNDFDDGEATGLLVENAVYVKFPTLFRVLTQETISVNKVVFRLGKERSYVDYFVTNNVAVSRSHADIITRGNRFFVIDLNSKNHTYINGQEIPVYVEVEIYNGDTLTLGNEEFIFGV